MKRNITELGLDCTAILQQTKIHVQIFSTLVSGSYLIIRVYGSQLLHMAFLSSKIARTMIMPLKDYAGIGCALDDTINQNLASSGWETF